MARASTKPLATDLPGAKDAAELKPELDVRSQTAHNNFIKSLSTQVEVQQLIPSVPRLYMAPCIIDRHGKLTGANVTHLRLKKTFLKSCCSAV